MSQKITLPTIITELSRVKNRLFRVERRLDATVKIPPYVCKWGLSGKLYLDGSMYETHPTGGTMTVLYGHLVIPGTTRTVVSFRKNGVQFAQLIWPPGQAYTERPVSVTVSARFDGLSAVITEVGAGAEDLSCFGVFETTAPLVA